MDNYFSTATTNSTRNNDFISADGKFFSAQFILDEVTRLARRFARTNGFTMSGWDVSNLASEVLCRKVIPNFHTYDSSLSLEAWLWTATFRKGCDLLRKEIRLRDIRRELQEERELYGEPYGEPTDAYAIRKENERVWYGFLASQSDEEVRECLRLSALHYKSGEIAKILGWPESKVYRTLCLGKKKLKDL